MDDYGRYFRSNNFEIKYEQKLIYCTCDEMNLRCD